MVYALEIIYTNFMMWLIIAIQSDSIVYSLSSLLVREWNDEGEALINNIFSGSGNSEDSEGSGSEKRDDIAEEDNSTNVDAKVDTEVGVPKRIIL